jgi:TonB family protein
MLPVPAKAYKISGTPSSTSIEASHFETAVSSSSVAGPSQPQTNRQTWSKSLPPMSQGRPLQRTYAPRACCNAIVGGVLTMAIPLHDFDSKPPLRFWAPKLRFATAGKWGQSAMKFRSARQFFIPLVCLVALLWISCLPTQAQSSARKLIKRVEPQYPAVLRDRGIGGTVRLKVTVRADGTVRDVQIQGGNPILAESAVRAVKFWRYAPAESEATADVVIHFANGQQPQ